MSLHSQNYFVESNIYIIIVYNVTKLQYKYTNWEGKKKRQKTLKNKWNNNTNQLLLEQ